MQKQGNARSYFPTGTELMTASNTTKSSISPVKCGSSVPHSGQDVVCLSSTKTVTVSFGDSTLKLDVETLQSLLCLLNGYMSQVMNGDLTALAFYAAKDYAEMAKIPEEKFAEVANAIFKVNDKRRKAHPFVASGFLA
jgi:hypothetical protein